MSKIGSIEVWDTEIRIDMPLLDSVSLTRFRRMVRAVEAVDLALRDGSSIEPDSTAVPEPEADPRQNIPATIPDAGVVQTATTPARHAGDAGSTPATRSKPLPLVRDARGHPLCPACGKATGSRSQLAHHMEVKHGAKSLAVDGDPTEPNGHDFKQPVLRHGIEWFQCAACPTKYTTKVRLDEHVSRAHRDSAGEAKRPTIAERVAARDASRAREAARRQRRSARA